MLEQSQLVTDDDHFRGRLKGYLETVLQQPVPMQDWSGHVRLPVFLTQIYRFFETRIGRNSLLFMAAMHNEGHTPAEISKHLSQVRSEFDGIVAYSVERLAANFRAQLISAGVAFAVPGNQLFVPELATDLREHFRTLRPKRPNRLTPSAQLVLFFHLLECEQTQQWTPSELAKPLGYSIMTMSRALDELGAFGLARIGRRGRNRPLSFRLEGRALIDSAKSLLLGPERRLNHVRWNGRPPDLPLAGEHALARLSDLANPSSRPVYAVTPKQMRDFVAAEQAVPSEGSYDSDFALATWRYDPRILAHANLVDPLSLYTQFWKDPDERLSMAAEQLLGQWK